MNSILITCLGLNSPQILFQTLQAHWKHTKHKFQNTTLEPPIFGKPRKCKDLGTVGPALAYSKRWGGSLTSTTSDQADFSERRGGQLGICMKMGSLERKCGEECISAGESWNDNTLEWISLREEARKKRGESPLEPWWNGKWVERNEEGGFIKVTVEVGPTN